MIHRTTSPTAAKAPRPPTHAARGVLRDEAVGRIRLDRARQAARVRAARLICTCGALPDRIALAHWYQCGPLEAQTRAAAEGWQHQPPAEAPARSAAALHRAAGDPDQPQQWVVHLVAPAAHVAAARCLLRSLEVHP